MNEKNFEEKKFVWFETNLCHINKRSLNSGNSKVHKLLLSQPNNICKLSYFQTKQQEK